MERKLAQGEEISREEFDRAIGLGYSLLSDLCYYKGLPLLFWMEEIEELFNGQQVIVACAAGDLETELVLNE